MQYMLFSQKTAAAAAFVGSLAVICLGATHAHAEENSDGCPTAVQEGVMCVQKGEAYVDEDGTHIVKQDQQCSTTDRPHVVTQQDQLLGSETVKTGPVVECSNTAKLPEGFKKPHINF
ncbi:conserved hypothetical protein [Streptomyces sviceus ATCC 29083]|uniref:Secreted protein n=2 Tax=Streptomyces TaxID=1883 RepID=B5HQH0_STRX2|nr:conserved hypothetical protein [Streptomyces sviceus ATCC 29083]